MKQFACGEVVPGCTAVFEGVDEEAILSQVAVHAAKDHGMIAIPASVVELVRRHLIDLNGAR